MEETLCDVLCIAPWTKLDLNSVFEIRTRGRRKVMNVIMVQNR